MKSFLILLAFGACLAYPLEDDKHHSQHRTAVDAARQGMQERLTQLEQQTLRQRQYGASENYVAGCTSGCSTGSSSAYRSSSSLNSQRSSANALENSDYVGVGILSHNNYGNDESDVQQRISSRYSSGNAIEADDLQQRVVPGDLSNIQSSAYRQSSRSNYREEEEEDVQKSIGAGYHDLSVNTDGYELQSQKRKQEQKESETTRVTGAVIPVYYVPGGSSSTYRSTGSNSESQFSESRTQRPVAAGQYVNLAVRPGTTTVLTIPVSAQEQQRAYGSRREYQAGSEDSRSSATRTQPGYRINYYPSYSATERTSLGSRTESDSSRTSTYQQPEKLTSTEYTSSRYNKKEEMEEEEEDTQQRILPVSVGGSRIASTTSGGATNYQQGYTSNTRVVPVVPVHTVESSNLQRTAEEQRRYNAVRPAYSQRTSANRNENEQASGSQYTSIYRPIYVSGQTSDSEGSQYGSSGSTYYTSPVTSHTHLQSQNQQGSSQSQYQSGSGTRYGPIPGYVRPIGIGSLDSTQTRFGSQVASGSDDLNTIMSESERLARIQQNQIAASQSASGYSATEANRRTVNVASNLDSAAANFISSSNLGNRFSELDNVENIAGTGGYKRVKSWQKQSKWASGSQYGTDGEPKSYSMLSTGESEKHNINGAETGYKAATTTLENDGKVSTYSMHTP